MSLFKNRFHLTVPTGQHGNAKRIPTKSINRPGNLRPKVGISFFEFVLESLIDNLLYT